MTDMPLERAPAFGASWNSGDADLVASYFAKDGIYCASVGPDRLGRAYVGKTAIRAGVQTFFNRFPGGRFEHLVVKVSGDMGSFEWDFVFTDAGTGITTSTAGCDLLAFEGDLVAKKNAFRKVRD